MSDKWPNGVPYIDDETRAENLRSTDALRDLIAAMWLYHSRLAETQLTTEQKELLADVVEGTTDYGEQNFKYDRWWQS